MMIETDVGELIAVHGRMFLSEHEAITNLFSPNSVSPAVVYFPSGHAYLLPSLVWHPLINEFRAGPTLFLNPSLHPAESWSVMQKRLPPTGGLHVRWYGSCWCVFIKHPLHRCQSIHSRRGTVPNFTIPPTICTSVGKNLSHYLKHFKRFFC